VVAQSPKPGAHVKNTRLFTISAQLLTYYFINIIKEKKIKQWKISKINLELKYRLFLNATNPNIKNYMCILHVTYMYTLDLMWSASVIVACKQEMHLFIKIYTCLTLQTGGWQHLFLFFLFLLDLCNISWDNLRGWSRHTETVHLIWSIQLQMSSVEYSLIWRFDHVYIFTYSNNNTCRFSTACEQSFVYILFYKNKIWLVCRWLTANNVHLSFHMQAVSVYP